MKRPIELLLHVIHALIWLAASVFAHPGCRYVADSVAVPDGVAVVCAAQQSEQHTETLAQSALYQKLPHNGILLGSATLTCDDPELKESLACTDWDLHGHRQWCIGGVTNKPFIDHVGGWLLTPPLSKTTHVEIIDGEPKDVPTKWKIAYRYANQPGRWFRNWKTTDPVTPAMVNKSPQWAATFAGKLGRDLRCNGELYRDVVEIPHGVTVTGRLRLDATAAMAALQVDPNGAWATPKARMLNWGMACLTPASGATWIGFKNVTLEGCYETVDWPAVAASPIAAQISQRLREGPYGAGISTIAQSGRVVTGLRVYIDNVTIAGFPSSCLATDPETVVYGQNLRVGPTVSGRTLYAEGRNHLRNLTISDFTRTSHHRGGAGERIDGLVYRSSGIANPWPQNDEPGSVASVSNARRDERAEWKNIDIDGRNSGIPAALSIGSSGVFSGKIRAGKINTHPSTRGAISTRIDLDAVDSGPMDLSWPGANSTANWANLDLTLNLRRLDNRPAINWSDYDDWSRKIDLAPELRVKRNASHPPGHTQNIRIRMTSDWPLQGLLRIADLATTAPEDCIPTTIWFEGGRFDNQFCQLIGANEGWTQQTWPENIADYPIRIVVSDAQLKLWQPGAPYRGDDRYAQQFAIMELRNCTTLQGVPIDPAKVIDGSFDGWAEVPQ